MWKWTDSNHIKAIIIDADSLEKEFFEFPYYQYIPEVKVFIVKDIWNFKDIQQECIEYYDISSLYEIEKVSSSRNINSSRISLKYLTFLFVYPYCTLSKRKLTVF